MRWPPLPLSELQAADLSVLWRQAIPLGVTVILTVIAVMMLSTAVETATRSDVDLDHEMRVIGGTNAINAALGGVAGYVGVAATLAARRLSEGHRSISLIAAALALTAFFLGDALMTLLPLPIFAGFLAWAGMTFLYDYLLKEVQQTTLGDGILTILIFGVIVGLGLFEGVIFGLVAGAAVFVVDYSRKPAVRSVLFGDVYHGAREHSLKDTRILQDHGDAIAIFKIQGYVFFGTAFKIRDRIKTLIRERNIRFLVIDFEDVSTLDGTAVATFRRIVDDLAEHGIQGCLSGMSPKVEKMTGLGAKDGIKVTATLDHGLQHFATAILAEHRTDAQPTLTDTLTSVFQDKTLAIRIGNYLERVQFGAGETVMAEGEAATDMYFVEIGLLDVVVGPNARHVRTLGPGALVGEISYYAGGVRTASVRASEDAVLWRFSAQTAAAALESDPELSSRFHAGIAAFLAQRVVGNTKLIQMLKD